MMKFHKSGKKSRYDPSGHYIFLSNVGSDGEQNFLHATRQNTRFLQVFLYMRNWRNSAVPQKGARMLNSVFCNNVLMYSARCRQPWGTSQTDPR